MTKSSFTREQLNAQALLLGMWYDHRDHSFNKDHPSSTTIFSECWDADTMDSWPYSQWVSEGIMDKRCKAVKLGTLGAADGPFEDEYS